MTDNKKPNINPLSGLSEGGSGFANLTPEEESQTIEELTYLLPNLVKDLLHDKPGISGVRVLSTTLSGVVSGDLGGFEELDLSELEDMHATEPSVASVEDLVEIRKRFGSSTSSSSPLLDLTQETSSEAKIDSSQNKFPVFSVGEIVFDKSSRRRGVVVDFSWQTKMYVVRWEDTSSLALVDGDALLTEKEAFKEINEEVKIPLEPVEKPVEKPIDQSLEEIISQVLKDPLVAPMIVERLLTSGKVSLETLSNILMKAGSTTAIKIMEHLVDKRILTKTESKKFLREIVLGT